MPLPNLDEYSQPDLYDIENPDFEPEGPLYLEIARQAGGPVLELGCGTGRMTIPLAQAGFEMTGLDIVPQMLERAREKAGSLPIRWVEADARAYALGQKFRFIFENGSVFMHMLTNADQESFLARAREHLAPGGRLLVSLFFPHPEHLVTNLEEKPWFEYVESGGCTVRVSGTESYDEILQVKTETAVRRITAADGAERVLVAPLALRYTFPQEMEALLNRAGFRVLERCGGPDRSPLESGSRYMVYLCALADDAPDPAGTS